MREYRDRMVQEIAACTCDRCSQRMSPDDDQGEWYEKVSLDWRGGFGSVFGDGAHLSIDLCQQCLRDTLGSWLRVDPPSATDNVIEALKGVVSRPDVRVTVDQMNPLLFGEQDESRGTLLLATRLAKIVAQAIAVFREQDQAIRWLVMPHKQFAGRTALEMAKTEDDARLVEEALVRIDEGYG
ncbi:MbcA/ParS/Xre antitoxin family protein [Paraburkholderia sp. MM5384-R2]|uniref:MbcA/ParS/Xre antitoxin family protein n=1 Tax=unclassified Paraburkholderia TaxID=2615204 RepID=UPI00161DDE85|nr:MbcA/ParS/Xre antitoxin family protein [Paraburkholderia sp. MM5384-R2]MBB5503171.1 hypothetical protein [Paraburkholderia sp. MM5384-R2]